MLVSSFLLIREKEQINELVVSSSRSVLHCRLDRKREQRDVILDLASLCPESQMRVFENIIHSTKKLGLWNVNHLQEFHFRFRDVLHRIAACCSLLSFLPNRLARRLLVTDTFRLLRNRVQQTHYGMCGWSALLSQRDSSHVGGVKVTMKCGASLYICVMQRQEQILQWIRIALEKMECLSGFVQLSHTFHIGQSPSTQMSGGRGAFPWPQRGPAEAPSIHAPRRQDCVGRPLG